VDRLCKRLAGSNAHGTRLTVVALGPGPGRFARRPRDGEPASAGPRFWRPCARAPVPRFGSAPPWGHR
jgi:hypothetical protein